MVSRDNIICSATGSGRCINDERHGVENDDSVETEVLLIDVVSAGQRAEQQAAHPPLHVTVDDTEDRQQEQEPSSSEGAGALNASSSVTLVPGGGSGGASSSRREESVDEECGDDDEIRRLEMGSILQIEDEDEIDDEEYEEDDDEEIIEYSDDDDEDYDLYSDDLSFVSGSSGDSGRSSFVAPLEKDQLPISAHDGRGEGYRQRMHLQQLRRQQQRRQNEESNLSQMVCAASLMGLGMTVLVFEIVLGTVIEVLGTTAHGGDRRWREKSKLKLASPSMGLLKNGGNGDGNRDDNYCMSRDCNLGTSAAAGNGHGMSGSSVGVALKDNQKKGNVDVTTTTTPSPFAVLVEKSTQTDEDGTDRCTATLFCSSAHLGGKNNKGLVRDKSDSFQSGGGDLPTTETGLNFSLSRTMDNARHDRFHTKGPDDPTSSSLPISPSTPETSELALSSRSVSSGVAEKNADAVVTVPAGAIADQTPVNTTQAASTVSASASSSSPKLLQECSPHEMKTRPTKSMDKDLEALPKPSQIDDGDNSNGDGSVRGKPLQHQREQEDHGGSDVDDLEYFARITGVDSSELLPASPVAAAPAAPPPLPPRATETQPKPGVTAAATLNVASEAFASVVLKQSENLRDKICEESDSASAVSEAVQQQQREHEMRATGGSGAATMATVSRAIDNANASRMSTTASLTSSSSSSRRKRTRRRRKQDDTSTISTLVSSSLRRDPPGTLPPLLPPRQPSQIHRDEEESKCDVEDIEAHPTKPIGDANVARNDSNMKKSRQHENSSLSSLQDGSQRPDGVKRTLSMDSSLPSKISVHHPYQQQHYQQQFDVIAENDHENDDHPGERGGVEEESAYHCFFGLARSRCDVMLAIAFASSFILFIVTVFAVELFFS